MNGDVWLLCLCFIFTELLLVFSIEHPEKQSCGTHGWESGTKRALSFLSSVIERKIPFLVVMATVMLAAKKLSAGTWDLGWLFSETPSLPGC